VGIEQINAYLKKQLRLLFFRALFIKKHVKAAGMHGANILLEKMLEALGYNQN